VPAADRLRAAMTVIVLVLAGLFYKGGMSNPPYLFRAP
jgi:hypothetical protein